MDKISRIVEELEGIKGALHSNGLPSDYWNWRIEVEKRLVQIMTRIDGVDRKLSQTNRLLWGLISAILSYVLLQIIQGGF